MLVRQQQNEHCLTEGSLLVLGRTLQLINERSSGRRVSLRHFLVGTRKWHLFIPSNKQKKWELIIQSILTLFKLDAGIVLSSQGATHVETLHNRKSDYKLYIFTPGPPSIVTSVSLYDRVRDDSAERKVTKCHVSWEAGGLPVRIVSH